MAEPPIRGLRVPDGVRVLGARCSSRLERFVFYIDTVGNDTTIQKRTSRFSCAAFTLLLRCLLRPFHPGPQVAHTIAQSWTTPALSLHVASYGAIRVHGLQNPSVLHAMAYSTVGLVGNPAWESLGSPNKCRSPRPLAPKSCRATGFDEQTLARPRHGIRPLTVTRDRRACDYERSRERSSVGVRSSVVPGGRGSKS